MEPTEEHFKQARKLWGLIGELRFIRRMENFVYEGRIGDQRVVLRLTDPKHRTVQDIEAELSWMDYLAKSGVRLAAPIASRNSVFVESLPDFNAAVFDWAAGTPWETKEDFSDENLVAWGRYNGRLNRLSKSYDLSPSEPRRKHWNQDSIHQAVRRGLDPEDKYPFERFNEYQAWIDSLEKSDEDYGLVHYDLHTGNFFAKDGAIAAFDFDDSCYNWYAADFGTTIYSAYCKSRDCDFGLSYQYVKEKLLEGYLKEDSFSEQWVKRLDTFVAYRAVLLYHWAKTRIAEGVKSINADTWNKDHVPKLLDVMKWPVEFV